MMRQFILGLLLLFAWGVAPAQNTTQDTADVPNPPAIPTEEERARAEQAASEYAAQQRASSLPDENPGQRTVEEGDTTVTEFSRGGQVHSLKIKSGQGPTQYLDERDDKQLGRTNEGLSDDVNLPKWRLGHW
jgi:hypothetical protein